MSRLLCPHKQSAPGQSRSCSMACRVLFPSRRSSNCCSASDPRTLYKSKEASERPSGSQNISRQVNCRKRKEKSRTIFSRDSFCWQAQHLVTPESVLGAVPGCFEGVPMRCAALRWFWGLRFCAPVRESGSGGANEKEPERRRAGACARLLRWSCSISYRNFRQRLARELTGILFT